MEPFSLRRVQMAFTDPLLPVVTVRFTAAARINIENVAAKRIGFIIPT